MSETDSLSFASMLSLSDVDFDDADDASQEFSDEFGERASDEDALGEPEVVQDGELQNPEPEGVLLKVLSAVFGNILRTCCAGDRVIEKKDASQDASDKRRPNRRHSPFEKMKAILRFDAGGVSKTQLCKEHKIKNSHQFCCFTEKETSP